MFLVYLLGSDDVAGCTEPIAAATFVRGWFDFLGSAVTYQTLSLTDPNPYFKGAEGFRHELDSMGRWSFAVLSQGHCFQS